MARTRRARKPGTGPGIGVTGLLLLASAPAWAAGQITGLQLSPTPACKGEPVTATVAGSGNCNKVVIRWEGTGPQAVKDVLQPPPAFPLQRQHVYDHTGQVTVKVGGGSGSNCQGQKQKTLTIQDCGGGEGGGGGIVFDPGLLCKVLDCGGTLTLKPGVIPVLLVRPKVTGALGVLQGGAPLIVGGKNFGAAPGKVHLLGANGERLLGVNEWSGGGIGGTVPADLQSICPTGEIQVETKGGFKSNRWKMSVPAVIQQLPMSAVKLVSCGTDGNENRCNEQSFPGASCASVRVPSFVVGTPEKPSISGFHENCWGAIGDDSGTDTYEISLKNGWVLDSAGFSSYAADGYTIPSSGVLPAGFQSGASYWKPQVTWSTTPADFVGYYLDIDIIGPACAPFQ